MQTTTATAPTNDIFNANLSWSQRFGDSLVSDRQRRLQEVARGDEMKLKLHGDRLYTKSENKKLAAIGSVGCCTAPTVAESFVPATGAQFRAMALRA